MKRVILLAVLFIALLSQACGVQSFLQASARTHSYTKAARQVLENLHDDGVLSREATLEIARPLQRFQAKQVDVFELWQRHRDPDTGEFKVNAEVAAEIAGILLSLRSDFAALKAKVKSDSLPSPVAPVLNPAIVALEKSFDSFASYLGRLAGVGGNRVLRILKAEGDQLDALYSQMRAESQEVSAWIN